MSSFKDLTGQKFGTLIVKSLAPDYVDKKGKHHISYLCKCEKCGQELTKCVSDLKILNKNGRDGCKHSIAYKIGDKFGTLIIKSIKKEKYKPIIYECECEICNTIKNIPRNNIQKIIKKNSDGCYHIDTINIDDVYGTLRVIKNIDNLMHHGYKQTAYECVCEKCGAIHYLPTYKLKELLRSNKDGCSHTQEHLVGERYGMLQIIDFIAGGGNSTKRYICKCDCGKIATIMNSAWQKQFSCGCNKMPVGEIYINDIFNSYNIIYETQVKFNDLTGVGGSYLSYDFGVYKNDRLVCLIEYQGKQHYEAIEMFGGEAQFEVQQLHDDLKREYAQKLGVPLIEIPYTVNTKEKIEAILKESGVI